MKIERLVEKRIDVLKDEVDPTLLHKIKLTWNRLAFFGHKGITGHQGGSLPQGSASTSSSSSSVNKADIITAAQNRRVFKVKFRSGRVAQGPSSYWAKYPNILVVNDLGRGMVDISLDRITNVRWGPLAELEVDE
jgi:hypothetical protein